MLSTFDKNKLHIFKTLAFLSRHVFEKMFDKDLKLCLIYVLVNLEGYTIKNKYFHSIQARRLKNY